MPNDQQPTGEQRDGRRPSAWMRTALLIAGAALGVAAFSTQHASAAQSVTRFGTTLAQECFRFADAHRPSPEGLAKCDAALSEELLNRSDRAATLVNRGILRVLQNDP